MNISDKEREIILEFLQWNDKNGCFTDKKCKEQGQKPFGKRDTLKMFFDVVNQNLFVGEKDENPLSFTYPEVLWIAKGKNVYFSTTTKLKMLLDNNSQKTYQKIIDMIK